VDPAVSTAGARRFVVGTAGHIDHGKTALVKALTGVDTDRWAEEKRRGITIDLGFAPLPLGDDLTVSLVEGFIRNMLAGATGIDVALLVIAADEGIMPQTEEHLAIVELLGVPRGIPVITKRDLVDSEWLDLVHTEVSERLGRSRVSWEPPVAVSAVMGTGLDDLRTALRRVAERIVERPADDQFRLPIDRVFALPGAGTVVTGSTWSGTVAVGESVRLLPLDRAARVRSIEVHGRPAERALPGRRTALALVGVDKDELQRGDVAVTGTGWTATRVFDAAIEVLPGAHKAITVRTRLRVHLGTAEVLARAIQLGSVEPGARGLARFALETPLIARGGDRFVLRSFSPVTTIGGGVVLDPRPPIPGPRLRHRGMVPEQALSERLSGWAAEAGLAGLSLPDLPVRLGVSPVRLESVLEEARAMLVRCGDVVVTRAAMEQGCGRVSAMIARHHADHPLDPGMSLQAIRSGLGTGSPLREALVPVVLDHLLAMGGVGGWELDGGVARLAGWRPSLDGQTLAARSKLLRRLAEARWEVPTIGELQREHAGVALPPLLAHLAREGVIEQVDQERYAEPEALASFRDALEGALQELGDATPAELRDRLGLTRKFLIPMLEWADRRGITERRGDTRRLALTARTGNP
jgi:selenocysteine-specific elongation factor